MSERFEIGDAMLFAVDALVENKGGTPEELTKNFWKALAPFAHEFCVGTTHTDTYEFAGTINYAC